MPHCPGSRQPLERLYREFDCGARASSATPSGIPLRYPDPARPRDRRASSPRAWPTAASTSSARSSMGVLARMGPSPRRFVLRLRPAARRAPRSPTSATASTGRTTSSRSASRPATLLARHGTLGALLRAGVLAGATARSGPRSSASSTGFLDADLSRACSRATASPTATATCSRARPRAGRASGCTSSCAGWSGASRPTSGCGRACRPRAADSGRHAHREHGRAIGLTRRRTPQLADGRGDHGSGCARSIPTIR